MTNERFGELAGCHYSMASRIRNGDRLPSRELLGRIIAAFNLDPSEALSASLKGARHFGAWLEPKLREPEQKTSPEDTPEMGSPSSVEKSGDAANSS